MKGRLQLTGMLFFLFFIHFSCEKENNNNNQSANLIEYFSIESIQLSIKIENDAHNIDLKLPATVDLTYITPKISISENATIYPASSQTVNLSNPLEYIVTASDGSERTYTISAVNITDTAIVIIDMQKGAFNLSDPFYQVDSLCDNICMAAAKTREAGKFVLYSQATSVSNPEGSSAWQVVTSLTPEPEDIMVLKFDGDAFSDSKLVEELTNIDVGCVILCGVATDYCINESFRGAKQRGYKIIMLANGHSTMSENASETIQTYNSKWALAGASVLKANEISFNSHK